MRLRSRTGWLIFENSASCAGILGVERRSNNYKYREMANRQPLPDAHCLPRGNAEA